MFIENIKTGWKLGIYGCQFALKHPKLLILPLLSAAAMFGVFFAAAYTFQKSSSIGPLVGALIFAYFSCVYIVIFFNVALVAIVSQYLEGQEPSLIDGFNAAINRAPIILVWALVVGSVGLLIRGIEALEEKFHIPSILSFVLDVGWAAATYFVVPIICFQSKATPKDLYNESARLISNVWGAGVVRIIGANAFVTIITLPLTLTLIYALQWMAKTPSVPYALQIYAVIGAIVVLMVALTTIINGTLQTLFYKYADTQFTPSDFSVDLIDKAIVRRR